jgi:hypothetical protein
MLIGVCSSSSQLNRLAMLVRTTCSDTPNIILLVVNSCKSHMIFKYFPSLVGYLSHFFWFKAKSFGGVTPTRAELGTWDVAPPVASSARVATGPREAPIDD